MVRLFNCQKLSLTHLLVFLLLLGNIGCQKEMSKDTLGAGGIVGGGSGGNTTGGTAVFTLEPAGSRCSDAAVTGVFEAGTTLGADALITVTVNVTKVGDWTYATAATNGFSFAGAGNFTATGLQVITLMGVGKPTRSGIFSFHLKIGTGVDCAVAVGVVPAGTGGGTGGNAPTSIYYKAVIDGTSYNVDITATSTDYAPIPYPYVIGTDDVVCYSDITWINPPLPAGKTEFSIAKGIMHQFTAATTDQFKQFFAPASYPYTPTASTTDGITISWTDPSGNAGTSGTDNIWSTDAGTKDQTGSAFNIKSSTEYIDATGYYMIVKAEFNCNLYNVTTGAKKVLTNGEALVPFGMN